MSGLKNTAIIGSAISVMTLAVSGTLLVLNNVKTAGRKAEAIRSSNITLGITLVISLFMTVIFGLSVAIAKKEKFYPRIPGDPKLKADMDLAVGEMNSSVVPRSEVEHQKGLVDWSPTFEDQECFRKDPAMFMRQKRTIRPIGDFEKRQIATQRHSGKDGRSDQKPRNS